MAAALIGGCLCGSVRFEVQPPFERVVHCHCSRCRKGTGTGHATNLYVQPGQLKWLCGEDSITRYDLPSARSFGKWFCGQCGSPLPRITRSGRTLVVPMGALDGTLPIEPTDHIFWGSRASWGCEAGALPTHREYPKWW